MYVQLTAFTEAQERSQINATQSAIVETIRKAYEHDRTLVEPGTHLVTAEKSYLISTRKIENGDSILTIIPHNAAPHAALQKDKYEATKTSTLLYDPTNGTGSTGLIGVILYYRSSYQQLLQVSELDLASEQNLNRDTISK